MNLRIFKLLFIFTLISTSCQLQDDSEISNLPKGKLFIIGGGKRPVEMTETLISISGVDSNGYIVILPMASGVPDTAAFYSAKQFKDLGLQNVYALNFESEDDMTQERIDSVRNAKLIYISGGDQNKFMKIVKNTTLLTAIKEAYFNGAVISGTSAGAAVMSKKMITGNENKHPIYTGNYRSIEANNIEIGEGLGLVENVIVDQHFVKRMRMNRLIAVSLENPEDICLGIDESTAILVEGKHATVYGISQVIYLKHKTAETKIINGLLGGKDLELSVFLPGESINLKSTPNN